MAETPPQQETAGILQNSDGENKAESPAPLSPEEIEAQIPSGKGLYEKRKSVDEIRRDLLRVLLSRHGLREEYAQSIIDKAEGLESEDDARVSEVMNNVLESGRSLAETIKDKKQEIKEQLMGVAIPEEEAEALLERGTKHLKIEDWGELDTTEFARGIIKKVIKARSLDSAAAAPEEVVSDADYDAFVKEGEVSGVLLGSIAEKIRRHEGLSEREHAIFADRTGDVEKLLKPFEDPTKQGKEYLEAREVWGNARKDAGEAEAYYQAHLENFYRSNEKGIGAGIKRWFGIRPKLPKEFDEMRKVSIKAREAYKKAGAELALVRYAVKRKGDAEKAMHDSDAVYRRYERLLAQKVLLSPLVERNKIQQEAVDALYPEGTPGRRIRDWFKDPTHKWAIRTGTVGTYSLIGLATGGIGAAFVAGGAKATGLFGGIVLGGLTGKGTRMLGEEFYVRGRESQHKKTVSSVKSSLFDREFAELEKEVSGSMHRVEAAKRNVRVAAAAAAAAAGLAVGASAREAGEEAITGGVEGTASAVGDDIEETLHDEPPGFLSDLTQETPHDEEPGFVSDLTQETPHDEPPGMLSDLVQETPHDEEPGYLSDVIEETPHDEEPGLLSTPDEKAEVLASNEVAGAAVVERSVVGDMLPERYVVGRGDTLSEIMWGSKGDMGRLPALAELPADAQKTELYNFLNVLDDNPALQAKIGLHTPPEGVHASDYIRVGQDINMQELNDAFGEYLESKGYAVAPEGAETPVEPVPNAEHGGPSPTHKPAESGVNSETEVTSEPDPDAELRDDVGEVSPESGSVSEAASSTPAGASTEDTQTSPITAEALHEAKIDFIESVQGKPPLFNFLSNYVDTFSSLKGYTFAELGRMDGGTMNTVGIDSEGWDKWSDAVAEMSKTVEPHMEETFDQYMDRYVAKVQELSATLTRV